MDGSRRVLVLNDESVQLELYSLWMEKEGYTAVSFEGSEEALQHLYETEAPPDLIVTELYMPHIDGWKVCRLLRSEEYKRYNKVPIIVISATFAGADVEEISEDLGADPFHRHMVSQQLHTYAAKVLRTK